LKKFFESGRGGAGHTVITQRLAEPACAMNRNTYPQHHAIAFLGFAVGHRPSTLRPLRRKGPEPDVVLHERRNQGGWNAYGGASAGGTRLFVAHRDASAADVGPGVAVYAV
jgi:hypothetical protein